MRKKQFVKYVVPRAAPNTKKGEERFKQS